MNKKKQINTINSNKGKKRISQKRKKSHTSLNVKEGENVTKKKI